MSLNTRHIVGSWTMCAGTVLSLSIGGCSERSQEAAADTALVVGAGADVSPSGAFQARLGVYPLNANVAETLTRMTPDFQLEPLLATRWEFRGGNTWRFHLRRGVFFHDGQPFGANAVRESMQQVARERMGYSGLGEQSVGVIDDSTVDITPTTPNLHLPQQISHPNYSIFAPGSRPGEHPVGTGPFVWMEYEPYQRVVVRRNAKYWGVKPLLERITFRFIPDATTRVLSLRAREVDVILDVPREQAAELAGRGFTVARAAPGQALALQLNVHGTLPNDLLAEPAIRRAIAVSLDRRQLIRDVWKGEAADVQNMTVPAILGADSARVHGFVHDPAAAARLLDSAGWHRGSDLIRTRAGRRLQLDLLASVEIDAGAVELTQAQLRQVGIDARWVRLPDAASLSARIGAGRFDINLALSNQNDADPIFLPALLFYSKSTRPFARWLHVGAPFDSVVAAALATSDPAAIRRLAAEAIHIAVDDQAVTIPIAALFRIYAMRPGVEGFVPHPSQTNQSWTTVHLKRQQSRLLLSGLQIISRPHRTDSPVPRSPGCTRIARQISSDPLATPASQRC